MSDMSNGLLKIAQDAAAQARDKGADEAEVIAQYQREARVDLQKNDLLNASTSEETVFGIRVFKDGALGFATVNDPDRIATACDEALAFAKVSPPDEGNGLRQPAPVTPLETPADPAIAELDIETLVDLAAKLVGRITKKDDRVMTDSGHVFAATGRRALATSTGIALEDDSAICGGSFFGMAVTSDEVGSFDHDGQNLLSAANLERELEAAADRFVIKTLGALGARKGESFRGPAILSPETVSSFVVSNLLSVLDASSVRTGKSPLKENLGEEIASPMLSLIDDPRDATLVGSTAFDREGTPTRVLPLLEHGVLNTFLYDFYEARRAGAAPTGHARGGASAPPSIGPSNLKLEPGDQSFTRLCCDPPLAVVVSRFSGSCNPITGEFSGVVKGGFLMRQGEKTPVKETLIAGNLYELLKNVSGVSEEKRIINGMRMMPSLRVEDISVTAG
ncbi:MAG: tldD/pmbA family protein [Deltaproteobacteria bacterium]|nr:tldD/pmbA family protein [Deltaproteobacteria bacterium]